MGRMGVGMEVKTAQAAMEAILFASGDPVPPERLAEVLHLDRKTVDRLLQVLAEKWNSSGGIRLIRVDTAWQMTTREEYAEYVRSALDIRRNTPLTQAAMEVLAVVAYHQPVTRGYIDEVRGVDCSGTVTSLMEKRLVAECGRLDVPGRPILYGTTPDFLRCFGLSSLDELPPLRETVSAEGTAPVGGEIPVGEL